MRAEIVIRPNGTGTIHLDGQEVTDALGFVLEAGVGVRPRMTLDMAFREHRIEGEMVVQVSESARRTLLDLGWHEPTTSGDDR